MEHFNLLLGLLFSCFCGLDLTDSQDKKKCLSFVVGYETVFLFWYKFKKNVQGSLKMHSQCCIVGNFALFWISAQYIPLFTFFRFPANDFSLQTLVISCLGSNYSTDMKRKCFFCFFFTYVISTLNKSLCYCEKGCCNTCLHQESHQIYFMICREDEKANLNIAVLLLSVLLNG